MGLFILRKGDVPLEGAVYKLKEPLSYADQVEHLVVVHGLEIKDREKAIQILSRVNYYRLSAYGIGLKKKDDPEKYTDGITLEWLFRLYIFDSRLRNITYHLIEQIEIQMRTQISHYLAMKYGAEGYMDPANFEKVSRRDGSDVYTSVIDAFKDECKRQSRVPFVEHHVSKYGGHFPVWVAVELFTFGNLASFFSVMKKDDQDAVALLYGTEANHLLSWMLSLVEIRNICAHYSRLYNMPLKQSPFLYKEHRIYRKGKIHKLFPVMLVLKRILGSDDRWNSYRQELESLMNCYHDVVDLSFIGFPKEWKGVLK